MGDTKKMKFHITITDNETGETLHDGDACAILASICENSVQQQHYVHCDARKFAATLQGAQKIVRRVGAEHPEVALLAELTRLGRSEETEETETKNEE